IEANKIYLSNGNPYLKYLKGIPCKIKQNKWDIVLKGNEEVCFPTYINIPYMDEMIHCQSALILYEVYRIYDSIKYQIIN
uniref:Uncharacterized protein n=1 Tax=Megaselia scalaris TaxID=36166 RepID=T1H302_MEGSC